MKYRTVDGDVIYRCRICLAVLGGSGSVCGPCRELLRQIDAVHDRDRHDRPPALCVGPLVAHYARLAAEGVGLFQ